MLTVDNSCCRDRWPPSVLVSGCSKLYAGKGIMLGHLFDAHQTPIPPPPPPFFSLRSLYETCRYRVNGFNDSWVQRRFSQMGRAGVHRPINPILSARATPGQATLYCVRGSQAVN